MPDWHAFAAILAVGAVCYAMRAGGFLAASLGPNWAMLLGGAAGTLVSALRGDDA